MECVRITHFQHCRKLTILVECSVQTEIIDPVLAKVRSAYGEKITPDFFLLPAPPGTGRMKAG